MRDRPQTGAFQPLLTAQHRPRDERRATDDEHVAVVVRARHDLLGHRVDRASAEQRTVRTAHAARRLDPDDDVRQLLGGDTHLRDDVDVPLRAVEHRMRGEGRRRVERGASAQRVIGGRLRRPEALSLRAVLAQPGEEPDELTAFDRVGPRHIARLTSTMIAIQQAGTGGPAVSGQRTQRRHHRRDVHADDVDVAAHLRVGGAHTVDPRRIDVVRQLFGVIDAQRMRHSRRRDDAAVSIGGDGLHRRRADVDPHGHFGHK